MLLPLLLCTVVSHVYSQESPVVETTIGSIQGAVASDGEYFTFYGVPYGGSTAGDNRFKGPTPAPVFEEVFDATDDSVLCAQAGPNGPIGVEDCLRLNIFSNNLTDTKPILVWVIGEEYTTSNPLQHSFRNVVDKFVVVALNYRLSVFGFLCLGIEEAPGNAGLKDVIQGLQWIQDNIAAFGGDPNNVVLFGHGSGAAMVDLITMSPLAEGLVHKAIYHSGSALAPWAVSYDPIGDAEYLRVRLRRSHRSHANEERVSRSEQLKNLIEILKSATLEELVNWASIPAYQNATAFFAACIENVELNPNITFLHDAPINLLKNGDFLHIPIVAGYTDNEGTIRINEGIGGWLNDFNRNIRDFLPGDLNIQNFAMRDTLGRTIGDFYSNDHLLEMRQRGNFLNYQGDILIKIPVLRSIMLRRLKSSALTHLLEFTYRGTNNSDWVFENIELTGVPHGGVLNFLLGFDLIGRDSEVMESLLDRYHNLARFGSPWESSLTPMWHSMTKFASYYFVYDGGYSSISDTWWFMQYHRINPYYRQYSFWSAIYDQHYRVPRPVSSASRIMGFSISFVFSLFLVLLFKLPS